MNYFSDNSIKKLIALIKASIAESGSAGVTEVTPEDALGILYESGAFEFVTDENGAVLTDENGAILMI